jgi:hypothetical protein
MRAVVILLAVVVLLGIIGILTGFINLSGTPGELPKVAVEGGRLPNVDADVGSIDVGTKNTTIEVPKVETKRETIEVPTLDVNKAR